MQNNNLIEVILERLVLLEKVDIQRKLDVFYAMYKLSDEEYTTLTLKVEDTYKVETAENSAEVEKTTEEE